MQIRSSLAVSYKATLLYYNWLQEQIAGNVPIDQMVQKLLGSVGGTFTNPATNYYQMEQDRLKIAENVAQVFMGMRIQCAQCHNHPFDRWTMDDYYSFAAFFAQIGRKQGADPRETIVFNSGGGEVNHLVGGRVMAPKFLGGATPDCKGQRPPRSTGQVARVVRKPVLRQKPGQHRLGPFLRPRHRRPGRRCPRLAIRPSTARCSMRSPSTSPNTNTTSSDWFAIFAPRALTSSAPITNDTNAFDDRNF